MAYITESTEDVGLAIKVKAFIDFTTAELPIFRDLSVTGWTLGDLPTVSEQLVMENLSEMGDYTKNY